MIKKKMYLAHFCKHCLTNMWIKIHDIRFVSNSIDGFFADSADSWFYALISMSVAMKTSNLKVDFLLKV